MKMEVENNTQDMTTSKIQDTYSYNLKDGEINPELNPLGFIDEPIALSDRMINEDVNTANVQCIGLQLKNNIEIQSKILHSEIDVSRGGRESQLTQSRSRRIPCYYFWSGISGVVFALLNSCIIFCAWPQHHIFTHPNFWHEFMTTAALGFIGLFSASLILNCEIWMNIKSIKTWKNFAFLYLLSTWAWMMANIGYYHIYAVVLKLKPPMPLNIHVCGLSTLIIVLSCFWYLIPSTERSSTLFWKRYGYYVMGQVLRYVAVLEYFFLAWLFVVINEDYQWIIAFILPIIREINGRMLTAACYKSSGTNSPSIQVTCVHEMGCRHAVFLSVAITLLSTRTTAFVCIGLDFLVNLLMCLRIIFLGKRPSQEVSEKSDVYLQILSTKEKVVCIVPISYTICFIIAYFGPNSTIIGNVGNTSWHFRKVENVWASLNILGLLFIVRILSIGLWSFLLRVFGKIRLMDGYFHIQQKFWLIMAIHEAYSLNEVSLTQYFIESGLWIIQR